MRLPLAAEAFLEKRLGLEFPEIPKNPDSIRVLQASAG